jgi:hypothetical protein
MGQQPLHRTRQVVFSLFSGRPALGLDATEDDLRWLLMLCQTEVIYWSLFPVT